MNSNMGHCRHSEGSAGVCSAGGPHAAHTDVHGARAPPVLYFLLPAVILLLRPSQVSHRQE